MTPAANDPVRDLARRPVVSVAAGDTLRSAAEQLSTELVGVAMVRDAQPPALLSERDIVAGIAVGADPDTALVEYVTTDYVVTISADDSVLDAADRMLMNEIRHLPIVEDGAVIGIVSERDLLAALADQARSGTSGMHRP
jgi:CBS domain-containing protein